ncbi:hypothetical protein DFS33DRAFT_1387464 [Desarmillaria ectypa]|nr:hypothetical protein DFS33DRAFT_1387464 [Desarmillaria ectypa]
MSKVNSDKKPYFGLTGMALSAWVNIACITDMFHAFFTRYPNSQLQDTIVSLYDIGWYVGRLHQFYLNFNSSPLQFRGAMGSFAFGEKLGRKTMLIIGVVVMPIGAIIQTAPFNVTMILVSRIINGQCSSLVKRDHEGVPSRKGDNSRDDVRFST